MLNNENSISYSYYIGSGGNNFEMKVTFTKEYDGLLPIADFSQKKIERLRQILFEIFGENYKNWWKK